MSTPATEHVKECNCRKKEQWPLEGQCLTNNIVHQAIVTTNTTTERYVGLATKLQRPIQKPHIILLKPQETEQD